MCFYWSIQWLITKSQRWMKFHFVMSVGSQRYNCAPHLSIDSCYTLCQALSLWYMRWNWVGFHILEFIPTRDQYIYNITCDIALCMFGPSKCITQGLYCLFRHVLSCTKRLATDDCAMCLYHHNYVIWMHDTIVFDKTIFGGEYSLIIAVFIVTRPNSNN